MAEWNRRTTRQPNHIGAMSSNFLALFTIQPAWFCRPPPMWCCAQHWSRMFSMWQQGLSNISGSLEKILINALRFIFVQQVIHNNKSVLNISHKRELEWNAQQMSSPNKERAIFSRVKLRPSIDLPFTRIFKPIKTHVRLFEGPAILRKFSKYFIECEPGARRTPLALQLFPGKNHSLLFLGDGPLLLLLVLLFFFFIIFCRIPSALSTYQDIYISRIIRKSHLHPAQMACPSTHCQILIGGFIS